MDKETRIALMETGLMRAAEEIGDINGPVMERYYARFPFAKASFDHHGLGNRPKLEAEMMDNVLYCLMKWVESRTEVAILLHQSVPHHHDTLKVEAGWYIGLLDTAVSVIRETIPADCTDELALWDDILAGLAEVIETTKKDFYRR